MAKSLKTPPLFNSEEDSYERFKHDIDIWKAYSDIDKKKMGHAVYLTLTGTACDAVRDMKVDVLSKNGGLDKLIEKLDAVFLKDKTMRADDAFQKFYDFKCDETNADET